MSQATDYVCCIVTRVQYKYKAPLFVEEPRAEWRLSPGVKPLACLARGRPRPALATSTAVEHHGTAKRNGPIALAAPSRSGCCTSSSRAAGHGGD
eukprot:scaffold149_cov383-Prasinococcus_capsulatus_cf.AAC.22